MIFEEKECGMLWSKHFEKKSIKYDFIYESKKKDCFHIWTSERQLLVYFY